MRIKGVETGRGSNKRGTPIELSPMEKAVEAVKIALCKKGTPDNSMLVYGVDVKDVQEHVSRDISSKGQPLEALKYDATGSVQYRNYNPVGDKLRPKVSKTFKIQFKNSRDDMGLPDLEVLDFVMK